MTERSSLGVVAGHEERDGTLPSDGSVPALDELSVSELRDRLARAEAANEELLALTRAAAHDLKAPVNTLGLLLGELECSFADGDEDLCRLLRLGQQTARRAGRLVEEVHEYTRVVRRVASIDQVWLVDVIDDVLDDLAGRISDSGATLILDVDDDGVLRGSERERARDWGWRCAGGSSSTTVDRSTCGPRSAPAPRSTSSSRSLDGHDRLDRQPHDDR